MGERFIKLSEKLKRWEWYGDPNTLAVWIHLLLKANWKDGRFKGITVKRGQLVTTISALSKEVGLTTAQIRTVLKHLTQTHELTTNGIANRYTLITIEKYEFYQHNPLRDSKPEDIPITNQQQTDDKDSRKNRSNRNIDIYNNTSFPSPLYCYANLLNALGEGELDELLSFIPPSDQKAFMEELSEMPAEGVGNPFRYALAYAKNNGYINPGGSE